MRVVVLAAVAGLISGLPPSCAKLLGHDTPEPVPTEAPTAATGVAVSSATSGPTAPPVWHPPDPVASTSGSPSGTGPAANPPASADLVKARAASDAKDFKKVRTLLEKKVRAGKCLPEESQLVFRACTALKDKPCAAEVKAKHGDDLTAGD